MTIIRTATALAMMSGTAFAGGVDRTGQGVGLLFETGNVVELGFGALRPSISGTYLANQHQGPTATGKVTDSFTLPSVGVKWDINSKIAAAFSIETPFGAATNFPISGPVLGGTVAQLDSLSLNTLLRYKLNDNVSVHGGLRAVRINGNVALGGQAYDAHGLNGYHVEFDGAWGHSYVLGAAYEIPEIALRVALTYNSDSQHDFGTTETFHGYPMPYPSADTRVTMPRSLNLDMQTGIAADTLLFASVRKVDWSVFQIKPTNLGGASLTDMRDATTYTLGVGRKFTDSWSGSAFVTYERPFGGVAAPLAPIDGTTGLGLAAVYTRDAMKITFAAQYIRMQDNPAGPMVHVADMSDNSALGAAVKVSFAF